jgi:hypothetical protein
VKIVKLLKFEIVKLLRSPAIPGFLAACLILNIFLVFASSHRQDIEFINEVTKVTGTVFGEEFMENLKLVPVPDMHDFSGRYWRYEELVQAAENSRNVFTDLDGGRELRERLPNAPYSDLTIQMQQWKYSLLTPVIEQKAADNDVAYVYFGSRSTWIHDMVFGALGKILAMQACVFFILIMLWTLGFENMVGTGLVIWSTKTGRKLAFYKTVAALALGTGFFIIIYTVTYGLTFIVNDFSMVWEQNVSAQYNMVFDWFFGQLPFITWSSMTIGEYFFASVAVALLNGIVTALFAIPFGLLIKNVYAAFCSIAGFTFLQLLFYIAGGQMETVPFVWNLSLIMPLTQILVNTQWFTDGGMNMLLPRFETFYPLICILLLCPVIIVACKKFKRKEIF